MSQQRVPKLPRDTILFFSGLSLVIHEAVIRSGAERPTLLLLFAAMMGLPFIFAADEVRKRIEKQDRERSDEDAT